MNTSATNMKDYMVGKTSFGLLGSGEQARIDEEAQRMLIARNGGVDDQSWREYFNFTPTAREEDLNARMQRMRGRGIDPLTGKGQAPEEQSRVPVTQPAVEQPAEQQGGFFSGLRTQFLSMFTSPERTAGAAPGQPIEQGAGAGPMGVSGVPNVQAVQQLERINGHLEEQTKLMRQQQTQQSRPNLNSPPNVPRR